MRIVAPFGFYGWGNIGDEATLNGFAQLLMLKGVRERVWVGSRNPEHCARVEPAFHYFSPNGYDPRRWWAKLRASAHAVIGGTPIMDVLGDWPLSELTPIVRSRDRRGLPIAFIGVGTEELRSEASLRIMAEQIVPRTRYWSVRSGADRERLIRWGVNPDVITVAADLAWLIEPAVDPIGARQLSRWGVARERPLIAVNVVNENGLFERDPKFVVNLASALDTIVDRQDARIMFLSNEVRPDDWLDSAAARRIAREMRHTESTFVAPAEYMSPKEMMSILRCCDASISMRYHFCLFSALVGLPFFAIKRSGKLVDLCNDLEWPYSSTPATFDREEMAEQHDYFTRNRSRVQAHLRAGVLALRERALKNVDPLSALSNGAAGREPAESLQPSEAGR